MADLAGGAIEKLADIMGSLLGGGSPAPTPKPPQNSAKTAKQTHAERVKAFVEAERQQRAAAMQEIANSLGAGGTAMTEEELRRKQEKHQKRSRDRGGGQSL